MFDLVLNVPLRTLHIKFLKTKIDRKLMKFFKVLPKEE